jgi:hypothetical protein
VARTLDTPLALPRPALTDAAASAALRPLRVASAPLPTAAPAVSEATGPRARCGDRSFLSLLVCMKRECDNTAALRNHPECVKMREQEEAGRALQQR